MPPTVLAGHDCWALVSATPAAMPTFHGMFIRKTTTRNRSGSEPYFTFRLVASERTGNQVRQITRLNLGRHFNLPQTNWPHLCARYDIAVTPDETGTKAASITWTKTRSRDRC